VLTLSNSDGFNFLFSSFTIILYPSFLSIVYMSLLNLFLPLLNASLSSNILTFSPGLNGTEFKHSRYV